MFFDKNKIVGYFLEKNDLNSLKYYYFVTKLKNDLKYCYEHEKKYIYFRLGVVFREWGKFKKALFYFDKALNEDKENVLKNKIIFEKANVYKEKGEYEKGLKCIENLRETDEIRELKKFFEKMLCV
jgi:tetratricopeptide (TPR) repeat protein